MNEKLHLPLPYGKIQYDIIKKHIWKKKIKYFNNNRLKLPSMSSVKDQYSPPTHFSGSFVDMQSRSIFVEGVFSVS